ncbi:hypothetical protein HCA44_00575 [Rhodococcus sp. HNM0569]|nr:hypothetical protein [Rhodococcus sp. HNM0569]
MDLGTGPAPEPAAPATVGDALAGGPVGDFLAAPLPASPMEALESSPLGSLLDTPLGELPPLPQLPPLPPNPIEALFSGQGLAGLPGIDQLLAPLTQLGGLFGSGTLGGGGFDPTAILESSSKVLDQVMSMSMSGLQALDQVWQSNAAQAAQDQGRQAQTSGGELSDQGKQIGATTQTAAAAVARGNANLETVAQSFAATAVAAAPVALTPPGQSMLLASAAEHLKAAVAIVTGTRTELNEHTLTMNGLASPVPVPTAPGGAAGGTSPFAVASELVEGVGKPLVSTVTDGVGQLASSQSSLSDISSGGSGSGAAAHTSAASAAGGASGIGGGGAGGVAGGGASASAPLAPAPPGPAPAPAAGAAAPVAGFAAGAAPAAAAGTPMAGGMGGAGMAGAGRGQGSDTEHTPSTPSYLQGTGSSDTFGTDLPMVAPAVIGADELADDAFD